MKKVNSKKEDINDKATYSIFKFNLSENLFTDDEIALLKKHGGWLCNLMNYNITAKTEGQKHFMQVCKLKTPPKNVYEETWIKYLHFMGRDADKKFNEVRF